MVDLASKFYRSKLWQTLDLDYSMLTDNHGDIRDVSTDKGEPAVKNKFKWDYF